MEHGDVQQLEDQMRMLNGNGALSKVWPMGLRHDHPGESPLMGSVDGQVYGECMRWLGMVGVGGAPWVETVG